MRLIDADALRQVLEVFTEKDTLGHTPLQLCDAMPAASPWHRVEDGLPPKATWVLTVATEGNVKLFNIATVDAGGQWWTCSPQIILRELYGVRYWMSIEPPKGV